MKFFRRAVPDDTPQLGYTHSTHEEFNQRFKPQEPQRDVTGPWIDYSNVPQALKAFNHHRDVPVPEKTIERNSGMIGEEQPRPEPKPPKNIRDPVDRKDFDHRWLLEQRDAVLAQVATQTRSRDEREYQRQPMIDEPSR